MEKIFISTDSNWIANTCGKYINSSQHSYSTSYGSSNTEPVSCTPQESYESISQRSNFSNSKSGPSFSDTSLIFSSPSKSVLTSKISDSSKSFKGPSLLHSKQCDNSNRDNVSYCNCGILITKAIDVNTSKLSETFLPLSNCNRYDVATYKAKASYLSHAEQKDLIKNIFVPEKNFVFPERERCFLFEWLKEIPWLFYSPSEDAAYWLPDVLFGYTFLGKLLRVKNLYSQLFRHVSAAVSIIKMPVSGKKKKNQTNQSLHSQTWPILDAILSNMKELVEEIDLMIDRNCKKEVKENRKRLALIIDTVILLGRLGLAFRGHRDDSQVHTI